MLRPSRVSKVIWILGPAGVERFSFVRTIAGIDRFTEKSLGAYWEILRLTGIMAAILAQLVEKDFDLFFKKKAPKVVPYHNLEIYLDRKEHSLS